MFPVQSYRFLITGGAGFIGSSLAETLVRQGAKQVRVLDDFSTGRRINLAPIQSQLSLIEGDLRDPQTVWQAAEGVDFILHQGAVPSVPRSIEAPAVTTAVNVMGTLNVLDAAVRAKVRRVVFASSSSVYGNSPTLPKHEEMHRSTLSPYAASKAAAELYFQSFQECFGLEGVCLRYFNIFGPKQDPHSQYAAVIPRFVSAIRDGIPVPVYGDGMQTRDFTFIANVIEANLKACFAPNAPGARINVGCGRQISLIELATTIGEIMGKPVTFEHLPARAGDVRHSLADITRARTLLGYEGAVSLREGLIPTVAYFLEQQG